MIVQLVLMRMCGASGDHVHLGPGVTAQRKTNPAVSMDELPSIDAILLSHFHEGTLRYKDYYPIKP